MRRSVGTALIAVALALTTLVSVACPCIGSSPPVPYSESVNLSAFIDDREENFTHLGAFSQSFKAGGWPSDVAMGDLNNDTRLDVAVASASLNRIEIFLQDEAGLLGQVPDIIISLPSAPTGIDVGDIDGDLRDDVAVCLGKDNKIFLYYQSSDFSSYTSKDTFASPQDVAIANIDDDSLMDFVVLSRNSTVSPACSYVVHLGSTGYWGVMHSLSSVNTNHSAIIVAQDYDGDGHVDLIFGDPIEDKVLVLKNEQETLGVDTWTLSQTFDVNGPSDIKFKQIDNTGLEEMIVTAKDSGEVRMYRYSGSLGKFESWKIKGGLSYPSTSCMIDLNDDYILDLITISEDDAIVESYLTSIAYGYGSTPEHFFPSHPSPFFSETRDFDSDGFMDIVIVCNATATNCSVSIYYGGESEYPSNAERNVEFQAGFPTSLVVGDFDEDGISEMGAIMMGQDQIVFIDNQSYQLGAKEMWSGPHWSEVVSLQGENDLVVSNWGSQNMSVFLSNPQFFNDPDPSMEIGTNFSGPGPLSSSDINGDGLQDIIVGCQGGIEILYNTGIAPVLDKNSSFSLYLAGSNITQITTGDFDFGMEYISGWTETTDVAVVNSSQIEVYLNDGSPSPLSASKVYTLVPSGTGQIAWMDSALIDDDELADIVVARDDGTVTVFFQDEGYTPFGFDADNKIVFLAPNGLSNADIGDIDDDGLSEISILGENLAVVTIFDVNKTVSPMVANFTSGGCDGYVIIEDLNNDLREDLIFSSPLSKCVSFVYQQNLPPIAFSEIITQGPIFEGQTVTFFAGNSTDNYSDIGSLDYHWDFGDMGTGNGDTIQHVFLDDGDFTVTLRVTDRGGLYDEVVLQVEIGDLSPNAFFDCPSSAEEGAIVQFTDLSSSYPDQIVNWTWEFGDGWSIPILEGGDPNVTHVFMGDGEYDVNLTVVDDDGSQDSSSITITITDGSPSAGFQVSDPTPAEGQAITFSSTSTSYPDQIVNWTWEFGDSEFGYGEVVQHTFTQDDTYTVGLTVRDSDGSEDTHEILLTVEDVPPIAGIGFLPSWQYEGEVVTFTDISTSYHPIFDWTWEFGDGDKSHVKNPIHVFETEGEYTVRLTVTDDDGSQNWTEVSVEILDTLVADFAINDISLYEGESIQFTDLSNSYHEVINWTWNFGDQNVSWTENSTHAFGDNGSYMVVLIVRASDGSEAQANMTVVVRDTTPVIDSLYTSSGITTILEDMTLQFRVNCTEGNDQIILYQWDFNKEGSFQADNTTTTGRMTARYAQDGIYTVAVRVWDSDSYAQAQIEIEVNNVPPTVELSYYVITSGNIHFFASSYSDNDSDMESLMFQWDFGQGYGTLVNYSSVDHYFENDDMYTVRLRVVDDDGAYATDTVSILVDRTPPTVQVGEVEDTAYIGEIIAISFVVTDAFEVDSVVLYYMIDDNQWTLTMVPSGTAGVYRASIPAQDQTTTIQLWVVATDSSDNSMETGTLSIQVIEKPISMDLYLLGITFGFAIIGGTIYVVRRRYAIDEVFIIFEDGCLISHESRRLKPGMDDDILSSMLVAIQEFVKDSFKDEEATGIRRLDFGDKKIMVEKGDNIYMAVVLHGTGGEKVQQKMQHVLNSIEKEYGQELQDWNGDLEKVRGIKERSKQLFESRILNIRGNSNGESKNFKRSG
ncbi:MAG: PKD domain-containing protein [Methanomassiliicoccales archaeon]|nr:PKD domain-containing protein [Methanomassiliicoccales archaeon]